MNAFIYALGTRRAMSVCLFAAIVFFVFFVVSVVKEAQAAPEDPHDRALVRALERQAKAQEEQASALKAIERHLRDIASAGGR